MENQKLVQYFKAVANARRLVILEFLSRENSASVSQIAREIHLSVKATSRHLAILKAAEIVETKQIQLYVFYSISKKQNPITRYILSLFRT